MLKKNILFLIFMFVLTPLGLISDFPAWGEWSNTEFLSLVGYIPSGMNETYLNAPLPDYEIQGLSSWLSTLVSALLGIGCCFIFFYGLKRVGLRQK